MSGETKGNASQWTVDTLKEHVEQRFLDQQRAVTAAFESAEKAVQRAEENAEKWRASANEWRGAMNDRERNLASRPELESVDSKVDSLAKRIDKNEGRTSGLLMIFAILASLGILVAIFMALKR